MAGVTVRLNRYMPVAPRNRPVKNTVLHTFTARIDAAPVDVFLALRARLDPGSTTATAYLADPEELLVVTQGSWWYRAEYRVVPEPAGATVEHVVISVAQRGERAARVAGRRVIQDAPLAFHDLVRSLRSSLE